MKIVGYCPNPGHGSVTSSLVLIGAMCADFGMKVLLLDSQWKGSMSMALLPAALRKRDDYLSTTGIDEIMRLWEGNRLNEENIRSGIVSISEQLDLVTHSTKPVRELYEKQFLQCADQVLPELEQHYDIILVDSLTNEFSLQQSLLSLADQILLFLPQNNWLLEQYFRHPIEHSNISYVLARYESGSIVNPFHLKIKYKDIRNKPIGTIPTSCSFMDAWSSGKVLSFLSKNNALEKGDMNYRFIHSVGSLAKSIQKGEEIRRDRSH